MEELSCIYCGVQNNPIQSRCSTCQQPLGGEIDIKLLTQAFNAPVIFKEFTTGWNFYILLFFGLLGAVSGVFRYSAFEELGLGYLAILWAVSGLLMILSLIGLRIKPSLILGVLFVISAAVQGFTLVFSQKFLSTDFLVGVVLVFFAGLAAWEVYQFHNLKKLPEAILTHAKDLRKRIFSANVDSEPGLIDLRDSKGSAMRVLLGARLVYVATKPDKDGRVVARNQFKISNDNPQSASETKATLEIDNKEAEILILPSFWKKYQEFINNP
jgi:hypothetical protein